MNIHSLLSKETIFLSMKPGSKEEIIRSMASGLEASGSVTDKEAYVQAVLTREQSSSTGIGFGVAIPHGKSNGVSRAGLAFAKLTEPTDWQSIDGTPVSMVFMIAVPEANAGNEHLQILVTLSRKLIHEEFRQKLLGAGSSDELIDILKICKEIE